MGVLKVGVLNVETKSVPPHGEARSWEFSLSRKAPCWVYGETVLQPSLPIQFEYFLIHSMCRSRWARLPIAFTGNHFLRNCMFSVLMGGGEFRDLNLG